jgi:hypothetical protein
MNESVSAITRSRQARGLLLFLSLVALVWVLSTWILTGSTEYLVMGGLVIAMIIITITILNDWRSGFFLFILWLLFEDLSRKYLGNSMVIYFGKDFLAAVTYSSLLAAKRRREVDLFRPPFLIPLTLFFFLAVVQSFNSWTPSLVYGLLGLKLYFYYIPLMFVGYALLRTGRDLEQFLVYNVALGLLIAVLGIIQSVVGLRFLNPPVLAPELQELGNLTRYSPITHIALPVPTSVFVSGGRFAWYVILVAILAMGAQAYMLLTRRRGAIYGFLGVGVAVVAAMQSGSRGSIIYVIMSALVLSAGFLWGAPWQWGQGHRLVKAVRRALLVGAAGLFLMVQFFPSSIGASWSFYSETLSPTSSASQLQDRTWDYPLKNLEEAFQHERWIIGYGTGTASLGLQYVAKLLGQRMLDISVENGFGTLIIEMGILGPILWLFWVGSLLLYSWRIVRQLRQSVYFPVAFSIFWYAFLLLIPFTYMAMNPYQNFVMNAYFWVLIGVLFRLPQLARTPQMVPSQPMIPRLAAFPAYVGGR